MPDGARAACPADLSATARLGRFRSVRARSLRLAEPLSAEDAGAQSMPDASPVKWHLAHTTWFFETLLLARRPGYRPVNPDFARLFNSYYESLGERVARPERGLMTRPSLDEVLAYRQTVDARMAALLGDGEDLADAHAAYLFELALNHEQQHQELILMDVLHLFSRSPLAPAYGAGGGELEPGRPGRLKPVEGGLVEIGAAAGGGFAYDNEGPRHRVWLEPYAIADDLVTNREWLAFMADGGYRRPELWLSDGWAVVREHGWTAPLYWREGPDGWRVFGLDGEAPVDPDRPVAHVSYYEADAFARWAGARLPSEAEWEHAASAGVLRRAEGALWQWTSSAYAPYPGFRPTEGAAAEYNGKFMANQMVLRGGSFATPPGHARASYRNFYYPHQRWMFAGLRLAADAPAAAAGPDLFRQELQAGLAARPKSLSPKWFYDAEGSRLFEEITRTDEYYPTRQEMALLARVAPELAAEIPDGAVLVEPGSGASEKTRILLDAAPQLHGYAPMDISPTALAEAADGLARDYPSLTITPVEGDFTQGVELPASLAGRPRVGFFPGSTIGNFRPEEAVRLLKALRATLGAGSTLILGVDMNRDEATLLPAYDDAAGVTARFNLNLLARANRELGADFQLEAFEHRAVWNAAEGRVEMHLVSRHDQDVAVGGRRFRFAAGETLHTEDSRKLTEEEVDRLATASGWRLARTWVSPPPRVGLFLLAA